MKEKNYMLISICTNTKSNIIEYVLNNKDIVLIYENNSYNYNIVYYKKYWNFLYILVDIKKEENYYDFSSIKIYENNIKVNWLYLIKYSNKEYYNINPYLLLKQIYKKIIQKTDNFINLLAFEKDIKILRSRCLIKERKNITLNFSEIESIINTIIEGFHIYDLMITNKFILNEYIKFIYISQNIFFIRNIANLLYLIKVYIKDKEKKIVNIDLKNVFTSTLEIININRYLSEIDNIINNLKIIIKFENEKIKNYFMKVISLSSIIFSSSFISIIAPKQINFFITNHLKEFIVIGIFTVIFIILYIIKITYLFIRNRNIYYKLIELNKDIINI